MVSAQDDLEKNESLDTKEEDLQKRKHTKKSNAPAINKAKKVGYFGKVLL